MEKENNKLFGIFKFNTTGDWITFFGSIIPFFLIIGNIINFLIEYFYFVSNDISTEFIEFNLMILLKNSIFIFIGIIFIAVLSLSFTFLPKIPTNGRYSLRKTLLYFGFWIFILIVFYFVSNFYLDSFFKDLIYKLIFSSYILVILFSPDDYYTIENIKQIYKIKPSSLVIPLSVFLINLFLLISLIIQINQQILARESSFYLTYKEKDAEKSCRIMRKYEKKIICQITTEQNSKKTLIIDIEKLDFYQIRSKN